MSNLTELLANTKDMTDHAFYSAELTDAYKVGRWTKEERQWMTDNERNLLSIRIFNNQCEVRLSRSDIGTIEYALRTIDDGENGDQLPLNSCKQPMYIDDWQLLDVDTTWFTAQNFEEGTYRTTGGGVYAFPLPAPRGNQHPAVLIRHYLASKREEGESGQTYVCDWRCVKFEMKSIDDLMKNMPEGETYGKN